MDNSLILEGYTLWAQLLNQYDQTTLTKLTSQSKSLSNLILLCYVFLCFTNKKGRYIAAFILCEITADTYIYSSDGGWEIFLINALVYSVLYWAYKEGVKTTTAYAMLIVFESVMILDARFYSDVKTVLYTNYEYIVTAIHLYIISTLLPWERIRRGLGDIVRAIYGLLSNGHTAAYISYCYNIQKEGEGNK